MLLASSFNLVRALSQFLHTLYTCLSSQSHSLSLSLSLSTFSVKEVDNTLTIIIVSALGGVIGLVIIVMVIKAVVVHFLQKDDEKK